MKNKILIIGFLLIGILTGCTLGNTPTSKVEDQLSKYQMLDDSINISYASLSEDTDIDSDYKDRYEELIRKQYRNMTYEIKEESIDGDSATVTAQIEVMDYRKIISQYNKDNYTLNEYHKLILDELEHAKDKVTYTIDFTLTKDGDGTWNLNPLGDEEKGKLLGMNFINNHIFK